MTFHDFEPLVLLKCFCQCEGRGVLFSRQADVPEVLNEEHHFCGSVLRPLTSLPECNAMRMAETGLIANRY